MAKWNGSTGTVYVPDNGVYGAPMAYRFTGDAIVLCVLLGVGSALFGMFLGLVA